MPSSSLQTCTTRNSGSASIGFKSRSLVTRSGSATMKRMPARFTSRMISAALMALSIYLLPSLQLALHFAEQRKVGDAVERHVRRHLRVLLHALDHRAQHRLFDVAVSIQHLPDDLVAVGGDARIEAE